MLKYYEQIYYSHATDGFLPAASHYELKMYTERDAEWFNSSTITIYCAKSSTGPKEPLAPLLSPAPFGTPQSCLTKLPFTILRWFFGIRAVDAANNTGLISNIVSAFVPDPPTPPPPRPHALHQHHPDLTPADGPSVHPHAHATRRHQGRGG